MRAERFYPIIALALLAALTIWLERTTRSPEATQRIERGDPDFIGGNVRVTSFDADGRLSYELDAVRVTHYPQDLIDLEQPYLRYHGETALTTVRAEQGQTTSAAERVELNRNVVVRSKDREGKETIVTGEHLTVWPDLQRAATDTPVVLKQGKITASGNGMRADNVAGTLDLLGNTHTQMPSSRQTRQ